MSTRYGKLRSARSNVFLIAFLFAAPAAFSGVAGAAGTGDAASVVEEELEFVPLILDVTDAVNEMVVVPAHVNYPDMGYMAGPGSLLLIQRPDGTFFCTANFIWTDGATNYLGSAGNCLLPVGAVATHGPGANYNPAFTTVWVCIYACPWGGFGSSVNVITGVWAALGPLKYARQGPVGDDFGIVTIPASLDKHLRASMPLWGGPTFSPGPMGPGTPLCYYGNGVGVAETFLTKGRVAVGVSMNPFTGVWLAHGVATPGDSGAPVVTCTSDGLGLHGRGATGILTHIVIGGFGNVAGTTVAKAQNMVLGDALLAINVELGI